MYRVRMYVCFFMQVVKGVLQRFGVGALTHVERRSLLEVMAEKPNVHKTCVLKLTEMQVQV